MEPSARHVFQFETNEDLNENPRFVRLATHYMAMMDRAVGLLGPELDLLTEILINLGEFPTFREYDSFSLLLTLIKLRSVLLT